MPAVRQFSPHALVQARAAADLSRMQLAADAGVHLNTLAHIEQGRAEPRAATLAALANAIGCDVSDFFTVLTRRSAS
jgi:transcriptional regulator with XRE-family HTH domain